MSNPLAYLGAPDATTNERGIIEIATVAETTTGTDNTRAVTPLGLAAVAIAGAPDASTTQKGIVELATDGEAVAGASSTLALVPTNLSPVFASPPPIGSTAPNSGVFTTLTATDFVLTNPLSVSEGGTGLTTITDHGVMLGSGTGAVTPTAVGSTNQVFIGQSAADPIWSNSLDLPGTLDVTGATTLDSTLTVAGAVTFNAPLTIDSLVIDDITIDADVIASTSTLGITATGAITVSSTANSASAIYLHANGGVSETIRIHADQGTGVASVNVNSDVGGITLSAGLATADAINITTTNAAGGIDIDAGTAGFIVDTTGAVSLDSAAASNLTVTGAFDLTVNTTLGSLNLLAGEAAVDAVRVNASNAAGGIDIDAGTGGITVDSTGAISIDAAAASNLTVTGAGLDLTLASVGGSVLVSSTENVAQAIYLHANGGTSETIQIHADQGTGVASLNLLSDVGGITLSAGLGTADAINITASNAAGGIDIDAGTTGVIVDTTGAISLDSAAASNFTVTGAFDLTVSSTLGSINVTAGEAVADAIVLNASNAAGGIDILTGGGEITISSAGNVTLAPATGTAASPTAGVTINARVGVATFTSFTTAAAATETFTITNSALGAGDGVFVTVSNRGTNDAQMTLTRVSSQTAGSLVVQVKNNGAAALNGDVIITFWVIN